MCRMGSQVVESVFSARLRILLFRVSHSSSIVLVSPNGLQSCELSVVLMKASAVVDQAPYNSTITQHVEYIPVTIDFMAANGCDVMLFSPVGDLLKAGLVYVSQIRMSSVNGGEILLKKR